MCIVLCFMLYCIALHEILLKACILFHISALHNFIQTALLGLLLLLPLTYSFLLNHINLHYTQKRFRNSTKRVLKEENNETRHLERWFSGNQKQIDIYLHEISHKVINNSKFLRLEWLEQENLNNVKRMLKHRSWRSSSIWQGIYILICCESFSPICPVKMRLCVLM